MTALDKFMLFAIGFMSFVLIWHVFGDHGVISIPFGSIYP